MKVIFIIDSLEGYGAEKSIVEVALRMKTITPVFIHLYGGGNLKTRLEKRGITVYSVKVGRPHGYSEAVKKIIPILEKEQPKIIHSTLYRADLVARRLKRIFPDILLVGSLVSNSYGNNRYKQLSTLSKLKLLSTQLKDRLTSDRVDFFICNSHAIKRTNIKALDILESKVKVIYRGRCFDDYKISPDSLLSLQEEVRWTGQKIFLNVGRLNKGKGQVDLLKAFKAIHSKNPNTLLLLAGEGPLRSELENMIVDLNLKNKVLLLGYRDDIPSLLALADFFVFPTYYEGLPGSLVEAIISGTPAIVSDITENKECFPGREALTFPPGDIAMLSEKMERALMLDKKDWKLRISRSSRYAMENFNIEKITEEYEHFYKEILEKKKGMGKDVFSSIKKDFLKINFLERIKIWFYIP